MNKLIFASPPLQIYQKCSKSLAFGFNQKYSILKSKTINTIISFFLAKVQEHFISIILFRENKSQNHGFYEYPHLDNEQCPRNRLRMFFYLGWGQKSKEVCNRIWIIFKALYGLWRTFTEILINSYKTASCYSQPLTNSVRGNRTRGPKEVR